MTRILALAFILAISAGVADAKSCKGATGKFVKCPPADVKGDMSAAKTSAAEDTKAAGMPSAAHAPVCKVGKPCGKSCISKDKVCHKPA